MYLTFRSCSVFLCAWMLLLLSGCGGGSDAPVRYDLTGTVSFNGEPVPYGEILFLPDNSKGNQGAGSVATIKEGRYQTPVGKGLIGGPYRVEIKGFDALPISGAVPVGDESVPQPLFKKYETNVDFPQESSTKDFQIPLLK